MENEIIEWISIEDKLPEMFEHVYVKTDCEDCPDMIPAAFYGKDGFIPSYLCQCDKHLDADEKLNGQILKIVSGKSMIENYNNRITHWISNVETNKLFKEVTDSN